MTKSKTKKEKGTKKGFEKSANFAKIAKVTRIFSFYLKTLSNKYRKNSKISKFDKILDLEREKAAKKGFEKSANFAKIAKATRIVLAMCKH